jgi:hypothetical protein
VPVFISLNKYVINGSHFHLTAIRANPQDPGNLDIYWSKSHLHEELGEKKKALEGYKAMMKIAPPKDGDRYMELARTITKVHKVSLSYLYYLNTI